MQQIKSFNQSWKYMDIVWSTKYKLMGVGN